MLSVVALDPIPVLFAVGEDGAGLAGERGMRAVDHVVWPLRKRRISSMPRTTCGRYGIAWTK